MKDDNSQELINTSQVRKYLKAFLGQNYPERNTTRFTIRSVYSYWYIDDPIDGFAYAVTDDGRIYQAGYNGKSHPWSKLY